MRVQILEHNWIVGSVSSEQLNGVALKLREFRDVARAIIKQGVLTKQGGLVKSWKRRTFVLTGERLTYHVGDGSDPPQGIIMLRQITDVRGGCHDLLRSLPECARVCVCEQITVDKDSPQQFTLATNLGRVYVIQAETEDVRKDWIKQIVLAREKQDLMVKAKFAAGAGGVSACVCSLLACALSRHP